MKNISLFQGTIIEFLYLRIRNDGDRVEVFDGPDGDKLIEWDDRILTTVPDSFNAR